jgi:hypothetical protein
MGSNLQGTLITDSGIILFLDGNRHIIGNDHPNFDRVREAIRAQDYDALPNLMNLRNAVTAFITDRDGRFTLENDLITLDGRPFSSTITEKVLNMIAEGNPAQPLYNFLIKVRRNPSSSAQQELLLFCAANGFMIHEDGDILAYKAVRSNYKDIHSGKNDNSVGAIVAMPRNDVDDRRDVTCSSGLHFAAFDYAKDFGGHDCRLMLMKVSPEHVVSIPNDYNNKKGRCCLYTVIAELTDGNPLPKKEVYFDRDVPGWWREKEYPNIPEEMWNILDDFNCHDTEICRKLNLLYGGAENATELKNEIWSACYGTNDELYNIIEDQLYDDAVMMESKASRVNKQLKALKVNLSEFKYLNKHPNIKQLVEDASLYDPSDRRELARKVNLMIKSYRDRWYEDTYWELYNEVEDMIAFSSDFHAIAETIDEI